jgi:spermidine synthase
MKPIETLARETTPEGDELVLTRRDGVYHLIVDGVELMTSRVHGSEEDLARLAIAAIANRSKAPRVLVGGLGFGYTLRAALGNLPKEGKVVVCELFASLLQWNRDLLGELAGRPLADRRVKVVLADVRVYLDGQERFDAILLDVDNGPEALTLRSNDGLYTEEGLERLARSLTDGGVVAFWSTTPSPAFEKRLRRAGFEAWTERVPARGGGKGKNHAIFMARLARDPRTTNVARGPGAGARRPSQVPRRP